MRHVVLISILLFASVGCGTMAPVLDVRGEPVPAAVGASNDVTSVRGAIVRAMTRKTWSFVGEQGQTILARVQAGGHWAVVRIDYDARSYSISYADSSPGLQYNGVEVHKRYNRWVHQLQGAIDAELNRSAASAPPPAFAPQPAPALAPPLPAQEAPAPSAAPVAVPPSAVPAPPPASATPNGG